MSVDWADLSTASKLLLAAGLLLFIDLFLAWQKVCIDLGAIGAGERCGSQSGWHGVGVIVGLLTLALIVWEALQLLKMHEGWSLPITAALISVALSVGIVIFTVIKFLADNEARHWPAWIGLLLAIAIAVGAWMKYSEEPGPVTTSPPEPPPAPPPAAPPA
jgi:hypothetical protein